jgi:hypothetical protein
VPIAFGFPNPANDYPIKATATAGSKNPAPALICAEPFLMLEH